MQMSAIIELRSIGKSFIKDGRRLEVLENICLEVKKGEILGILGPSGCGKSTLLRLIAGFEKPDCGSTFFKGREIAGPDTDRIMVFQDFNQLLPWKTVLRNVLFPLEANKRGSSDEARYRMSLEYLEMVRLTGFNDYYPHQLSGGMKQKVAIARSLVLNPDILLMDEPFGSLDALTRLSMQEMLLDVWRKTHITIVFVTHDIQEAVVLSDRIVVMGKRKEGIRTIAANGMDRPRTLNSKGFTEFCGYLLKLLE